MKKSYRFVTLAGLLMGAANPISAWADRTIFIPPVFSNKDFVCSTPKMERFPMCYDFSITNLSNIPQAVTITWKAGSYLDGQGDDKAGVVNNIKESITSDMSHVVNFSGTRGENQQVAFCYHCWFGKGCKHGVVPGATPGDAGPAPTGGAIAPAAWVWFHANGRFQLTVAEDRGALIGRMTQRVWPTPGPNDNVNCRDLQSSPLNFIELNGGRAF